jgi:enoyl-CoA hydratase/carnithine racemase
MWTALRDVGRSLPGSVRVVVVAGAGPSFSSGLDLGLFDGSRPDGGPLDLAGRADADEVIAGYQDGFSWLSRTDLVSIAAVHGHAIGAGFQLALACDLRVAADDARFAMREPSLGLVPDLGGTRPLVHLVGYARALEICLTGRSVPAEEALRIGLVTLVVPPGELAAAVDDLVAAVLAPPRDAVVETKALITAAWSRTLAQQLAAEREAQLRRLRDLAGGGE